MELKHEFLSGVQLMTGDCHCKYLLDFFYATGLLNKLPLANQPFIYIYSAEVLLTISLFLVFD